VTPLRVLLVNHTAQVSGAEHSLLALATGLSDLGVECTIACPAEGPLVSMAQAAGLKPRAIVGTEGSLRLHPTATPTAVSEIGLSAFQVARLARRSGADIVHGNSLRASLSSGSGARVVGVPAVSHLRDRLPPGRVSIACLKLINATSAAVIANSSFTAEALSEAGIDRQAAVIANPVDLSRFRPPSDEERSVIRSRLGLSDESVVLGVVGQIAPWKAQAMAIQVLGRLIGEIPTLHLLVVGEAKFPSARLDNAGYLRGLRAAAEDPSIAGRVDFLGERRDIPDVLRALDVLLLPSIGEPFGRVIVEAMAVGTPVVASADGGPGEIIQHMSNGVLVDRHEADAWVDAVRSLVTNSQLQGTLAAEALRNSEQYSIRRHAEQVMAVYRAAIDRTSART
jgi:L-malate glycosyltransferase